MPSPTESVELAPMESITTVAEGFETSSQITAVHAANKVAVQKSLVTISAIEDASSQLSDVNAADNGERRPSKGMAMWKVVIFQVALTCSLGMSTLPKSLVQCGTFLSATIVVVLGLLCYFTNDLIWQFIMKHPDAASYPAMMRIMWGPWGFWLGFFLSNVTLVMIMGAHTVGFGLGVLIILKGVVNQKYGSLIGAFVMGALSFTRAIGGGVVIDGGSSISFALAILLTAIGVGLKGSNSEGFLLFPSKQVPLSSVASANSAVLFVFMSHLATPALVSRMRDPSQYPRANRLATQINICLTLLVTILFQYLIGLDVKSPILASAEKAFSIAAWVIGSFTIILPGTVSAKIATKDVLETLWEPCRLWCMRHLSIRETVMRHRVSRWILIVVLWCLATAIAIVIPKFENIVPVTGAFCSAPISLIIPACLWLLLDETSTSAVMRRLRTQKWKAAFVLLALITGCFLTGFGSWGTVVEFQRPPTSNSTVPWPLPVNGTTSVTLDATPRAF